MQKGGIFLFKGASAMIQKQHVKFKLYTVPKDQPYIKDSDLQIYELTVEALEESSYRSEKDKSILKMLYAFQKKELSKVN